MFARYSPVIVFPFGKMSSLISGHYFVSRGLILELATH